MWLGINYTGLHDSSIALIDKDGAVELAVSEDRLSRLKNDGRFPQKALELVDMDTVCRVAVASLTEPSEEGKPDWMFDEILPAIKTYNPMYPPDWLVFPASWRTQCEVLPQSRMHFEHHQCHAASGYFLSGFKEALVVTSDAGSPHSPWTFTVSLASPDGLTLLHGASVTHYRPLAFLYSYVTAILGFQPLSHEGKVTGLAAFGKPDAKCRTQLWDMFIELTKYDLTNGSSLTNWVNPASIEDPPRLVVDTLLAQKLRKRLAAFPDEDIAYAAQDILTEKTLQILDRVQSRHQFNAIVLAGGIFANVKLNQEVKKQIGRKQIFICPAMGDEGVSLGAAALAWAQDTNSTLCRSPVKHMFFGIRPTDPSNQTIQQLLDSMSVIYHESDSNMDRVVAELLSEGKIVALVRGSMEFGPRALGHRSILCDARDPTINITLNHKLKRTEFMPFAPIIRQEDAVDCFEISQISGAEHTAFFMTICFNVSPNLAAKCPAIVHIDGTARPQFVSAEVQPYLHAILTEYRAVTGCPALINTSFNLHGEPIVATVSDAVKSFLQSEIDYLCVENCLIPLVDNLHLNC